MTVEFTTPVGRIVWGSPTKSRGKTRKNAVTQALEPVMKDGVQVQVWSFGVAFDKATFQASIWPYLSQEAATLYQGGQVPAKFAWKYTDCEEIDDNGKRYGEREGYEGCYVLAISTELQAPPVFKFNGTSYDQLPADAVKCGDFVAVGLNVKGNIPSDRTMTPSLYINPTVVEFVGYGKEIVSATAVNPMTALGGRQHQLPPGASATPIGGGNGVGMPGMGQPMAQPGMGQTMAQPGMMPQQPMQQPGMMPGQPQAQPQYAPQPMAQPAMMPPPAHDFVQGAGQQPQPMQQPQAQPQYAPQPMAQPGMMQPGQMPGMMPGR
jgi:hypothetical protein